MGHTESEPRWSFEAIGGYFAQGEKETDPQGYDYVKHNFGLIDRSYETDRSEDKDSTQWQRFEKYVNSLIEESGSDTRYIVLYVGRHGEGYHNVAEAKYGTKEWDAYWAKLTGDGELFWDDAHLTDTGKQQALSNHAFLQTQFSQQKMPQPQEYYSSPLYRCLQTAELTYEDLQVPKDRPFEPLIKEMLREVMGVHTCDRRSSKTVIHEAFPEFEIEHGFEENDVLWKAEHRETHAEHDVRTKKLLQDVFDHGRDQRHAFVSFTSHSGSIASLLRVLGHREFRLPTGGMIPLFVKATWQSS